MVMCPVQAVPSVFMSCVVGFRLIDEPKPLKMADPNKYDFMSGTCFRSPLALGIQGSYTAPVAVIPVVAGFLNWSALLALAVILYVIWESPRGADAQDPYPGEHPSFANDTRRAQQKFPATGGHRLSETAPVTVADPEPEVTHRTQQHCA